MKKPLYFYLFLIGGAIFLTLACVLLGFLIYYIVLGNTLNVLILALLFPLSAGGGTALLLYAIKILKHLNLVSMLISLYPDFIKTDSFEISTHGFTRSQLLIDGKHKNFIFLIKDQIVPQFAFRDIISYSVYENETKLFEGTRDNIKHEQMFGNVRVSRANFMSDYVRKLQVVLHVNSPICPNIVINFLGFRGVDRLGADYREYVNSINKLCRKINYMMSNDK